MNTSTFFLTNTLYLGTAYDLYVEDGRIKNFAPSKSFPAPSGVRVIDAHGYVIFPSFVDAHTHMRDPGQEYKEDIISGLTAAAYGGFGGVMAMANTSPVNDTASITRYMLEKAKKYHPNGPMIYPIGALTVGLEGQELAPMGELSDAGCVAFSNDGRPVKDSEIFRRSVEYASEWDKVVIDHCEDHSMAKGTHMNEGVVSGRIGIKGQPTAAEAIQVARDIVLAEYLGISIHLAHISCKQSVDLIRYAKEKGVKVTAETCPHYLLLDETQLEKYNSLAKVNPPLRTQEDCQAIIKAVQDGTIDIFVTDHAPHADHEKNHPLDSTPNGLIGLETAVALTYTFVRNKTITEKDFIRLWHDTPAKIFNLDLNFFKQGDRADFFLFNPKEQWIVSRETIKSKSCNTPFLGETLQGRVTQHWMNGVPLLSDNT